MKIREIKGKDIFKLSRIIKKLELRKNFKLPDFSGITEESKKESEKEFGLNLVITVLENMYLAEKEIIEFIAELSNTSYEEVEELSFTELKEILTKIFADKGFLSFLQ